MEDIYYSSSNIKMVLENYLKETPVHQVRKHCEETICLCRFLGSTDKNLLHYSQLHC